MAQLVAHLLDTQEVAGSIPAPVTGTGSAILHLALPVIDANVSQVRGHLPQQDEGERGAEDFEQPKVLLEVFPVRVTQYQSLEGRPVVDTISQITEEDSGYLLEVQQRIRLRQRKPSWAHAQEL